MKIELYIANQLCDLEQSDLSVRLKRQFINPTELNTKDAQKSYTINLPSTPNNDEIFRYKNVEETDGKFTLYPDARLYVNGLLIMEGKFRLSEITRDGYKGNLGVPAPLTAKDVFGERKMNDVNEWLIDFKGEESLDNINISNQDGSPKPCVFPLALYRILPNRQSPEITNSTSFILEDFPPSINCLEILKHSFNTIGYQLGGTAMDDHRLKHLFVSYRNPNEHEMPYEVKDISISGVWNNLKNRHVEAKIQLSNYEGHGNDKHSFISCNLFDSDNLSIDRSKINDSNNKLNIKGNKVVFTVPRSGLYKISLDANINLIHGEPEDRTKINDNLIILPTRYDHTDSTLYFRCFNNTACELKLMRTRDGEDLELSAIDMDATFTRNNEAQQSSFPKSKEVLFIDPAQNKDLLCGFSWGRVVKKSENYQEPIEVFPDYENKAWGNGQYCHTMATKHGKSWSDNITEADWNQSVVYSPGYVDSKGNSLNKYIVNLKNSESYAKLILEDDNDKDKPMRVPFRGEGKIEQVVYLKQGERIHLVTSQGRAQSKDWIWQEINFTLNLKYFSESSKWIDDNMDSKTNSSKTNDMDWNASSQQLQGKLNLARFLPTEIKIDDWINNFCKAFNLELVHIGDNDFALNIKSNTLNKQTSIILDLDKKTSVVQASNSSLSLPRVYKLGFTIDTDEQGYVENLKKDSDGSIAEEKTGGGIFHTGNNDAGEMEQKSNFSYCWYKTIETKTGQEDVPVITDSDVWSNSIGYTEALNKRFYNKAQRFWYKTGKMTEVTINQKPSKLALVSNTYNGNKPLTLDYEDKPDSIMRQYFMLLDSNKSYTTVECYLTPDEYHNLDKCYVKFNGDLYLVAEADGYDPMGKSKTKLKLLKKE